MRESLNPFWRGLYAFNDGSSLDDCPYPRGSTEARFWCEGYALAHALANGRNGVADW
ncbi:ribosome modulation factor [Methylobacterium flocculans]|uniref:ribosome modulation factor n=1 Tax=Methylobacterium flocculans TaxID=2984843 RepID=UPI00384D2782